MDGSELIHDLLDGDEDAAADEAALDRARLRLREVFEAERLAVRRRRRWGLLAVAAALGVVVAVVVPLLLPSSRRPTAAAELRHLARVAASGERLLIGPDEFLLMRSEELRLESLTFGSGNDLGSGVTFAKLSHLRVSTWVTSDGSGYLEEEVLSSRFATDLDRQAWIDAGKPQIDLPREGPFVASGSPLHDTRELPRAPGPLLQALREKAATERSPGDDQVFILIGELLAQGDATPTLRAALFEAAARLVGVEFLGDVTDPLGRAGEGISFAIGPRPTRLIFDPGTSMLLARELSEERTDGRGTVETWIAYQPSTIVDSPPPGA